MDEEIPTLTKLERTLNDVLDRNPSFKNIELQLIIDNHGLELSIAESGEWILHQMRYFYSQSFSDVMTGNKSPPDAVLSEEIKEIVEGVNNLNAQGYKIKYFGPKNLEEYHKFERKIKDLRKEIGFGEFLFPEE